MTNADQCRRRGYAARSLGRVRSFMRRVRLGAFVRARSWVVISVRRGDRRVCAGELPGLVPTRAS